MPKNACLLMQALLQFYSGGALGFWLLDRGESVDGWPFLSRGASCAGACDPAVRSRPVGRGYSAPRSRSVREWICGVNRVV